MSEIMPTSTAEVAPSEGAAPVERKYAQGFLIRGAQPTRVEAFVDAAFAFAVTLLVVSVGSVPDSVEALVDAMRGVPAFAASFIVIAVIWQAHRKWSQRYGLEDGYTIRLSLALVFIVLLYVYPLRMMFTLAMGSMSGGLLWEHPVVVHGPAEMRALYIIYAVGYGVVALIIAQLNRYALRHAQSLALSAYECLRTRIVVAIWRVIAGITLLSLVLALVLPMDVRHGLLAAVPGLVYMLIWPALRLATRHQRAQLAALQPGRD